MGKPSDQVVPPGPSGPLISSPSSSSAAPPPQRFFDDDPTELSPNNLDLPPQYEEIAHEQPGPAPGAVILQPQGQDSNGNGNGNGNGNRIDNSLMRVNFGNSETYGRQGPAGLSAQPFQRNQGTEYYIDATLASDPAALEQALRALARVPPRPFAVVRGTHTETETRHHRSGEGERRTEDKEVVDFEVEIEMTHLLFAGPADMGRDIGGGANGGTRLRVVGNQDNVRRGTVRPTRAPGFSGSSASSSAASPLLSSAEEGAPSVQEWCHRFCASDAGLKAVSLRRRAVGFDFDFLKQRLEEAVRATNYRGRLEVRFPLRGAHVEIFNDCRTNRWRLTNWVVALCYMTLLFVVTWPWLWLRTKHWDTFYTEWRFSRDGGGGDDTGNNRNIVNNGGSNDGNGAGFPPGTRRYTSMSEQAWLDMWTRPLQTAVLQRRRGQLNQRDLVSASTAGLGPGPAGLDAAGMEALVRAGAQLEAMGIVNRWFSWGGDQRDGAGSGRWGGDRRDDRWDDRREWEGDRRERGGHWRPCSRDRR